MSTTDKSAIAYLRSLTSLGKKADFRRRFAKWLNQNAPARRDWAEFGVYAGDSAKIWLRYLSPGAKLFLFDAWKGLPTAWGHEPAGTLTCPRPKFNDSRAIIVEGWFHETLPNWRRSRVNYPGASCGTIPPQLRLGFVHVDCDVYASVAVVLEELYPLIDHKTILLFDEFCHDARQREHEYRAFQEFVAKHQLSYEYLARSDTFAQVAVRLLC